jgi:ATP-binding cassette subfamily B protein
VTARHNDRASTSAVTLGTSTSPPWAAITPRAYGAVRVLISHRFSTVRLADLIVVVDGGSVVATRSHDELVAQSGLYADHYAIQARAYR